MGLDVHPPQIPSKNKQTPCCTSCSEKSNSSEKKRKNKSHHDLGGRNIQQRPRVLPKSFDIDMPDFFAPTPKSYGGFPSSLSSSFSTPLSMQPPPRKRCRTTRTRKLRKRQYRQQKPAANQRPQEQGTAHQRSLMLP